MKNFFLLLFATLILVSCQQEGYKINITFNDKPTGTLYLLEEINRNLIAIDSLDLTSTTLEFKGKTEGPTLYYLRLDNRKNMLRFFPENTNIDIFIKADSIDKAHVKGSKTNDLYSDFIKKKDEFVSRQRNLISEYRSIKDTADTARLKQIEAQVDSLYNQEQAFTTNFAETNITSIVSLFIIRQHLIYLLDYQGLDSLLLKVPENLHSTNIYLQLDEQRAQLEKTQVGKPALDFSMENTEGEVVSINNFKGKYLLIDFWASWCGPCRYANPYIVELYNKYNKFGFEILGVSFDNNREKWLEAIKADNLTWTHVSDLKGWQNAAGALYGVKSIPHTILIDKDGIIVGNRMSHEELAQKLSSIFNQ